MCGACTRCAACCGCATATAPLSSLGHATRAAGRRAESGGRAVEEVHRAALQVPAALGEWRPTRCTGRRYRCFSRSRPAPTTSLPASASGSLAPLHALSSMVDAIGGRSLLMDELHACGELSLLHPTYTAVRVQVSSTPPPARCTRPSSMRQRPETEKHTGSIPKLPNHTLHLQAQSGRTKDAWPLTSRPPPHHLRPTMHTRRQRSATWDVAAWVFDELSMPMLVVQCNQTQVARYSLPLYIQPNRDTNNAIEQYSLTKQQQIALTYAGAAYAV